MAPIIPESPCRQCKLLLKELPGITGFQTGVRERSFGYAQAPWK